MELSKINGETKKVAQENADRKIAHATRKNAIVKRFFGCVYNEQTNLWEYYQQLDATSYLIKSSNKIRDIAMGVADETKYVNGKLYSKTSYQKDGKVSCYEEYSQSANVDAEEQLLLYRRIKFYDNGNIQSEEIYDDDGKITRCHYYDEMGKYTHSENYDFSYKEVTKFAQNKNETIVEFGHQEKFKIVKKQGANIDIFEKYAIDENGTEYFIKKKVCRYNENGKVLFEEYYDKNNVITERNVYQYYSNGTPSKIVTYDSTGQLLRSKSFLFDGTITGSYDKLRDLRAKQLEPTI